MRLNVLYLVCVFSVKGNRIVIIHYSVAESVREGLSRLTRGRAPNPITPFNRESVKPERGG